MVGEGATKGISIQGANNAILLLTWQGQYHCAMGELLSNGGEYSHPKWVIHERVSAGMPSIRVTHDELLKQTRIGRNPLGTFCVHHHLGPHN